MWPRRMPACVKSMLATWDWEEVVVDLRILVEKSFDEQVEDSKEDGFGV
jgi:hypothetical protein